MASIFNTVEVNTGKTARILNFLNSADDFFIAIGKPTPWDNSWGLNVSDANPPSPTVDRVSIVEPIIYKRVKIGSGAGAASKNTTCGDFNGNEDSLSSVVLVQQTITQKNYTIFTAEEIVNSDGTFARNPEFIYVSGSIFGEDYTAETWRASALYTKLFFKEGVPNNLQIYTPDQVKGGLLQHLTFNTPVEREDEKEHKFEYLINV
jgi:hypothetical protein